MLLSPNDKKCASEPLPSRNYSQDWYKFEEHFAKALNSYIDL